MVDLIDYSIEPLFTIEETSFLLGATQVAVSSWVDRGMVPVVYLQGRRLIRQRDVAFIMHNGRTPNSGVPLRVKTPPNYEPNRRRTSAGRVKPPLKPKAKVKRKPGRPRKS
jgi:hypothetical protein